MSIMYNIRIIDENKEKDEFRKLFKRVFGFEITAKLWEWKYLENPMISDQPLIYIAEHEGEMIGARPFLPNLMKFGNRIFKVAQPCDTMVHPEHQRKGIFTKMTNFAIKDMEKRGYVLFYGFPNQLVGKIYKNSKYPSQFGWQIISKIYCSYKFFSPEKLISSKISGKILGNIAIFFSRYLSSRSKLPFIKPAKSYDINEENTITEEFEELWERGYNWKISTVRDEEYLRWRFIKHPENEYRFLAARKNKELLGYFVTTNIVSKQNLIEGQIVDYIIKENNIEVFLSLLLIALDGFKKRGCDSVSIWAFTQPEFQRVLDRCGFIGKLSFPYKFFTKMDYFVVNKIVSNYLPINPLDKKNWYITQADADYY